MANLSLLAASLVMALLGWGWFNAFTEGIYDFFSFLRREETPTIEQDAIVPEYEQEQGEVESQEFDEELDTLDEELDQLLREAETEFDDLEADL